MVEDEPAVRRLAATVLAQQGYRVFDAADGAEALEIAARPDLPFDLVLTDVVMPGLSGGELVQRLAPLQPGVRVLYMSGYPDDSVVRAGVRDASVAYLQKPFTTRELCRRVRVVLDAPPGP